MLLKWDDLPEFMQIPEVKPYYDILDKKRGQLILKRIFDVVVAAILFVILAIPMLIIAISIKRDSEGPVFYRQERVTKYGQHFYIHKFRTMVNNADQMGTTVTVGNDSRITKVGEKLRARRFDEFPQLIDILQGKMSFVGTRPEAVKYVKHYKPEYYATLLLPAGITSDASIHFKNEAELLDVVENTDKVYMEMVLPEKMRWNLNSIQNYSFTHDIITMFQTTATLFEKDND